MAHVISFRFSISLDDENKLAVKERMNEVANGLAAWIVGNKLNAVAVEISSLAGIMTLPPPVMEDQLLVTNQMPPAPPRLVK